MTNYNDDSIKVLSDIDHVRKRASMYISTDRPSYQMWTEIADNAIDEAMNGYATEISFGIDYDLSSILVEDNGRGLPQGINKDLKKPTIYAIYQKLNAGGKYDQESYGVSGGLNGVGSTVVNALSKSLRVVSWRDRDVVEANFEYGEDKGYKKYKDSSVPYGSGTRVFYTIDTEHSLFTDRLSDYRDEIEDKISLLKTLIPNVKFRYNGKEVKVQDFRKFLVLSKDPLLDDAILISTKNLMVALNWSKDTNKTTQRTYCNSIYTHNGGDHEKAVHEALASLFGTTDISYGLNVAVSAMYPAVEYDSQAKTKAISKDMRAWVATTVVSELKSYFKKNPNVRDTIMNLVKYKRDQINKRNNKSAVRRDKKSSFLNALSDSAFADCNTKDRSEAEMFIVEGNSAAGSARQSRNVSTQAIAPIRGKIINAYTNSLDSVLKNREVGMLMSSIDCGMFEDVNVNRSRYGKIIAMCDADPDGLSIVNLLLGLFTKLAPDLIEKGYFYVALPPLYGTYVKGEFIPINTEELKNEYLNKGYEIKRFKGLGEMNPEELAVACMNPETRNLLQVRVSEDYVSLVEAIMGGDASVRREILVETGVLDDSV